MTVLLAIQKFILKSLLNIKYAVLYLITRFIFRYPKINHPKCIIVFRTCLLGDFLFSLPSIALLRKKFPAARIVFMTTFAANGKTVKGSQKYLDKSATLPWFKFILPSLVDEILNIEDLSFKSRQAARKRIKELNPDLFFILPHPGDPLKSLLKKIVFLKVLGISKNLYGWKVWGDYSFFKKIQHELGLFGHKVSGPLRAIKEYKGCEDIDETDIKFPLKIAGKIESWADGLFTDLAINDKIIALSIGSVQPHKKWPIENFIILMEELRKKYDCVFILIGTKNDIELGQVLETCFKENLINLIGNTSVEQLAAVLKRTTLLIGNDGGALHVAAAVKCTTVSIIPGLEFPNSIEPWGFYKYSVRHAVSCAPCYSMTHCPLGHNKCMVELPVESVLHMSVKALTVKKTYELVK